MVKDSQSGKEEPKPPICQLPLVNVFKHFKVDSGKGCTTQGSVEPVMDKIIGKKVYRIVGHVLAANYLRCPPLATQSLGLTGRYLYAQIRTIPYKYYVLHIYAVAKDDTVLDISITNLFSAIKLLGNVLQYPCDLSSKWVTICIDMVEVMKVYRGVQFKHLKGVQACSNMFVRNVVTTDTLHTAKTLPKDLDLPTTNNRDLEVDYDWHHIPAPGAAAAVAAALEPPLKQLSRRGSENTQPSPAPALAAAARPRTALAGVGNTLAAEGAAPRAVSKGLKDHVPDLDVLNRDKAGGFQPDPAMELRWCIGHTGQSPGTMLWTRDSYEPDQNQRRRQIHCACCAFAGRGVCVGCRRCLTRGCACRRNMLYACSTNVISLNPDTNQQKFFFGHTATVTVMALSPDDLILATCQEGKDPVIRLWEVASGECVAMLAGHGSDLVCIDFDRLGQRLIAVGKEDKGAGKNFFNLLVMWDISAVLRGGRAHKVVEQSFEPSLFKVRFTPFEEARLVSCGHGNINLWRIKRVRERFELRRMMLQLGTHGTQTFLDLAFEGSLGSADLLSRKIYASTASGLVYQINYTNQTVDQIYRLHDAAINALVVTDGFCVTGSADRFLRVWPLDFSDYFLEAEHAAPVSSLSVSADCLRVAIGTANGTVGVMDVPSHGYRTVVRSHESIVLALAMDPHNREFTTTAADGTIRTWDLDSYDQLYEFLAPGEFARSVVYHPRLYVIACGFENGSTRVFDIGSTTQLQEYRQHQGMVVSLVYTPDGSKLFSAGADGLICVYDAVRNYQPVKTVVSAHAGDNMFLSVSANGRLLASLGVGGASALLFNTENMDKVMEVGANGRTLKLLQFAPLSNELFAITHDCRLHRYDLDTGELANESTGLHLDSINTMDWSENGKFLLTGGHDGLLKMWAVGHNGPHLKRCQSFIGHPSTITRALFSPDKKQAVSVGAGFGIMVWDLMVDTNEDVSEFVDRLIDARVAEQQRQEHHSERSETPPPQLPVPSASQQVSSLLESFRDRMAAPEWDSESDIGRDLLDKAFGGAEPSPLVRVRERAAALDLSMTPTHAGAAIGISLDSSAGGVYHSVASTTTGERASDRARPGARREAPAERLPAKHYMFRRGTCPRAERKYVASEDEAGLRMARITGCATEAHDALVWHPSTGYFAAAVGSTVVVEDLETREQKLLLAHEVDVSTLALDDAGALLASASGCADGPQGSDAWAPVFVWDCARGTIFRRLDYHQRGVQALAWSPCSKYLLSVGNVHDGKLVVWDVAASAVVVATELAAPVHAASFCGGPSEFVTAGHQKVTFWLKTDDGKLHMQDMSAPNEEVGAHYTCLDMSAGCTALFVGSDSGGVSQWEVNAERNACTSVWQTMQGELSIIKCLGDKLVTCGEFPHIRIWGANLAGGTVEGSGQWAVVRDIMLDGPVHSLSMDAGGAEGVAATTTGGVFHLGSPGVPPAKLGGGHAAEITGMVCSDSGELLASCSADGTVVLWAVDGMQHIKQWRAVEGGAGCCCVAFAPSGRLLAAGYADGVVRQMDVSGREGPGTSKDAILTHAHGLGAAGHAITALEYTGGSEHIFCGTEDGAVKVITVATGDVRDASAVAADGCSVCSLQCAPDQSDVWLTTFSDGSLVVFRFDMTSGQAHPLARHAFQHQGPLLAAFSATQPSTIVCCGAAVGRGMHFFSLTERVVSRAPAEMDQVATSLAVSPGGYLVTLGTAERLVKVVDFEEGTFQDFTGHSDGVGALAFAPSGTQLFTSANTEIIAWDVCV